MLVGVHDNLTVMNKKHIDGKLGDLEPLLGPKNVARVKNVGI